MRKLQIGLKSLNPVTSWRIEHQERLPTAKG